MLAAACRLADLGARLHPDHRADLVFEQVLRAPIAGDGQASERSWRPPSSRATPPLSPVPEPEILARLLNDERRGRALALGAAMRLGFDLSGRSADLLRRSRLSFEQGHGHLTAEARWADMLLGEQTAKRASSLADVLERGLRMDDKA